MRAPQRALIDVIAAHDGVTEGEFHDLLLRQSRSKEVPDYEFVRLGQRLFSFTAAADLEKLIRSGLLRREGDRVRLAAPALIEPRQNPARCEQPSPDIDTRAIVPADVALCTIGYEGRSLENYLNRLTRSGVTMLCDVRRNPLSRKFGFSKGTLSKACAAVGVAYEHLPELGIASERRRNLVTQDDREALFSEYARDTLPNETEALDQIGEWIRSGSRIALTCYEAHPTECHRNALAAELHNRLGSAYKVQHL